MFNVKIKSGYIPEVVWLYFEKDSFAVYLPLQRCRYEPPLCSAAPISFYSQYW